METHTIPAEELEVLRSLHGRYVDEFWFDYYTSGFLLGDDSVITAAVSVMNADNCHLWYELFRMGIERDSDIERYRSFMTCAHRRLGLVQGVRIGASIVSDWGDDLESRIVPKLQRYRERAAHLAPHETLDTYVTHPDCHEDVTVLEEAGVPVASLPVGVSLDLDSGFSVICMTVSLMPVLECMIVPTNADIFSESVVRWESA